MTNHNIDRIKGKTEEIGGTIQKNVGKLVGSEELERKGKEHERHGEAVQENAKLAERVKGTFEKVAGAAKQTVGEAVGSDSMQRKGKVQELKGKARKEMNK